MAAGNPTGHEAAALIAAVQIILESESAAGSELPFAYRSGWRRTAIDEGVNRRPYASSITALGRPMSRPSGGSNDLGGSSVS